MTAIPPDYESDPQRWASHDRATYLRGDVHEIVAGHITGLGLRPVLDIGCGDGQLLKQLPPAWPWIGLDSSPRQLRDLPAYAVVLADARRLPFADASFACVTALWMLYHLDEPVVAVREAYRVLRPGGVFFACTSARDNDPELTAGYPRTTFDAEEASGIVASVFGDDATRAVHWDARLVRLPDRTAVLRYLRSHRLAADRADQLTPPITLTKRGCLVTATRP